MTTTEIKAIKKAVETYEEALDAECNCGEWSFNCKRCRLIEMARRIAEKQIGPYEQK